MLSKYRHSLRAVYITGLAFVVNYFITFFLTRFLTAKVGVDTYGFVSMAKDFAQYATYATIALNAFAVRYITLEYHNERYVESNKYYSSVFFGDFIIGTIVFIIAIILIFNLEKLINIDVNHVFDVKILFLFVFFRFWLNTVFNVYSTGAYVSNKLYITGVFKLISYIVEAVVLLIIYTFFKSEVWYVGLALVIAAFIIIISNVWITRKYAEKLQIKKALISIKLVFKLMKDGIWSLLSQLGNVLQTGLDMLFCNLFVSTVAMGQLSIAKSIVLIVNSAFTMVSTSFQPLFLKTYSKGNIRELITELKIAVKLSSTFSNIAFAGFFALGLSYYELWIPNQEIGLIYNLTIVCLIPVVISGILAPLYYVHTLTVKKKIPCFINILCGVLNAGSMYILLNFMHKGVFAVVWTTAVIAIAIGLTVHPIYVAYLLKVKFTEFYGVILRCLISCGIMTVVLYSLSMLFKTDRWLFFILVAVLYLIIGCIIQFIIVFNKEEKAKILGRFIKKLNAN